MKDLEKVAVRMFQEMAALAVEAGAHPLPQRGVPIPHDLDELGRLVAERWLRTGQRPSLPAESAAAFPRFWFASTFLRNALVHQTQHPLDLGRTAAIPAALMLDLWDKSGRALWEAGKDDFPWAG